jgi:hypothetical protein
MVDQDNRHAIACALDRDRGRPVIDDDHVDVAHELRRHVRHPGLGAIGVTPVENEILAHDPAQLAEAFDHSGAKLGHVDGAVAEEADASVPLREAAAAQPEPYDGGAKPRRVT